MRKINPWKAVAHALGSVVSYRAVGVRIGIGWIVALWVLGLAEYLLYEPRGDTLRLTPGDMVGLVSSAVGLVGFCAIAVAWHRFVLRDEIAVGFRVGENVWRYIGNTLLILLAVLIPVGLLAAVLALLPPASQILLLPAAAVCGVFALRLSVKLPAVALGRRDFGFRDALAATRDNTWQLLGVFALNAAIVLGAVVALMLSVAALSMLSEGLAAIVGLTASMVLQLFYTLFNASIFTSLYGYFVERRDF